ncbi:hypothetical protein [Mycolicibacterium sp. CBMA 226]|uniref:hypothetical protein n=1 Tax=Mycolicibacterium sp. CBMA 226 TaxID=2606611 RepID=UPI0012DD87AF|nr:hypothetical protein [Mycolicibacterium sp. CBMA 226]MUL74691.1 hypothetical protein [Mycolicibacterium sp. CBMA 226]
MRRDDALLTVAGLSVSAFLVLAGPTAIAAADPGGSHGNSGNSKSGSGPGGASRGNSGNGGSGPDGNSGGNASAFGKTNTGKSSKANGNGNGNGNGRGSGNGVASGAQSNSGSHNPAAAPTPDPPNPPRPVVVAEHHTGTTRGGRAWWPAPGVAAPTVEGPAPAPSAPSEGGAADLLSADHTGVPVWAAAEPVGVRGDLFGLAGLVLMPLVGLVVGYRQAKAVRDVDLTIGP